MKNIIIVIIALLTLSAQAETVLVDHTYTTPLDPNIRASSVKITQNARSFVEIAHPVLEDDGTFSWELYPNMIALDLLDENGLRIDTEALRLFMAHVRVNKAELEAAGGELGIPWGEYTGGLAQQAVILRAFVDKFAAKFSLDAGSIYSNLVQQAQGGQ